ncbi:hypothetical protein OIU85_021425 [Salix viminalis]|uniref:Uncharacterized protein n=1 Tax=Salix viminalis TaxID=40686 RepID=A0A9Q0UIH7_SALVM|nr:hypothetical protein OIU85_021425 [Salix viminalis]
MAGYNCHWDHLLAASLGDTEERTGFHVNVHSVSTDYNSNFLSILVERNPSLGKCWWRCFVDGWALLCIMGQEQRRWEKLTFKRRIPSSHVMCIYFILLKKQSVIAMVLLDQCVISKTNEVLSRKCSPISGMTNPLSSNTMAKPKKEERQSEKKLS